MSGTRHRGASTFRSSRAQRPGSTARAIWHIAERVVAASATAIWRSSTAYRVDLNGSWRDYAVLWLTTLVLRVAATLFTVLFWVPFLLWLVFKLLTY